MVVCTNSRFLFNWPTYLWAGSVGKVEIQRWGNCNFRFWLLLVVVAPLLTVLDPCVPVGGRGPETTKFTSLSGNQAFTFMSLTWMPSRKEAQLPLRNRASATYFFVAKLISIAHSCL